MAHPGGRPPKYTEAELQEIANDLEQYIEEQEDPTIVGFIATYTKYPVNKAYMSEHEEFSNLNKRAIAKQEAFLLKGATTGKLNPAVSIFRLKQPQHGYTDKTERDISIKELPKPIMDVTNALRSNNSDK